MSIVLLPAFSTYARPTAQLDFGGFAISLGVHAPREVVPPHRHEDEYLWCLVLQGGFEEACESRRESCAPGSLVVRPPDCVHADRFASSRGVCLSLFPRREWLSRSGFDALADTYTHQRTRRMLRLGAELASELAAADLARGVAIEALVAEIFASAVRMERLTKSAFPRWLVATLDEIESDPCAEVRLGALADSAGVSAPHLARTFRSFVGRSVGQYVRDMRLAQAAKLIDGGAHRLCDVASATGFYDQAHFSRAFKARFGVTPRAYARHGRS